MAKKKKSLVKKSAQKKPAKKRPASKRGAKGKPETKKITLSSALAFVSSAKIPVSPQRKGLAGLDSETPVILEETKMQALVVGSALVSFGKGVSSEHRDVIVSSALLAQLVANKKVPSKTAIQKWYDAYFDTLMNVGWVVQERGFIQHTEKGAGFEAHQAIIAVAATVLGAGTTALAMVTTTLNGLKEMGDGPWMTVFKRESQSAKAAKFQTTVAEKLEDGSTMISLMAFEMKAKANLVQVLFFKFRNSDVTLKHASGKVTVDLNLLTSMKSVIADKINDHRKDFIKNLSV